MNKTFIIIGREFSTRVRKKSFLVLTLLVPILFAAFYGFLIWMLLKKDTQERKIAVINYSTIEAPLHQINNTLFDYDTNDLAITENNAAKFLAHKGYYAVLWIPEDIMQNPEIPIYSLSQVTMDLKNEITGQLSKKIEDIKRKQVIDESNIPDLEQKLAATKTQVTVRTLKVDETGKAKESSAEITTIFGMVGGTIIYIFIFMYASQVMKGVIEEKTNRIIEVLVSSVKPFQFLMGKIIGVAAVGLVQFLLWLILGGIIIAVIQAALMPGLDVEALRNAGTTGMMQTGNLDPAQVKILQNIVKTIDPAFILSFFGAFIFYFIGGYLLYASLFAAIGAAVDNETDSQQFMTPLSIILIIGLYIGIAAMRSPESPIVFWSSMIPFTSPTVMLVRIPFGVPLWEVLTSMAILVASFIFFTWLSGKIYRVGILMYGKKVTWKELYKWLKY